MTANEGVVTGVCGDVDEEFDEDEEAPVSEGGDMIGAGLYQRGPFRMYSSGRDSGRAL